MGRNLNINHSRQSIFEERSSISHEEIYVALPAMLMLDMRRGQVLTSKHRFKPTISAICWLEFRPLSGEIQFVIILDRNNIWLTCWMSKC